MGLRMFGGPFLEGWNKFCYWQGPEVWGIFQKFARELLKIWNITEKIFEKCKIFTKFSFFARTIGKIRIIIYVGYNVGGSWASPRSYKIFNNFLKKKLINLLNLSNFRKFGKYFPQFCSKTIKYAEFSNRGWSSEDGEATRGWAFDDFYPKFLWHPIIFFKKPPDSLGNLMIYQTCWYWGRPSPPKARENFKF